MKILHISAQRPDSTGSGVYLSSIVWEATKKNYEQALIVGLTKGERVSFPDVQIFPVYFESDDLNFPIVGMSNVMPYKSTLYCDLTDSMLAKWTAAFRLVVDEAVERFQPDIILSHHLWLLTVLIKNWHPEIPLIAICHGTGLRQMEFAPNIGNYVLHNCHKIDKILALTEYQKRQICKSYHYPQNQVFVSGSGYNCDLFHINRPMEINSIGIIFAGKICASKGIFSLIRALDSLKIENIMLTIAGAGSEKDTTAVMEMCSNSHLNVLFTGNLSQKELAVYFQQNQLFVLSSFFEGLSLVLIEAIASGMNIVTTDLPGLRDFLGHEFCQSEFISFVPLPALRTIDSPEVSELPSFEINLQNALLEQINNIATANIPPEDLVERTVSSWQWRSLFNKIESQMKIVLNNPLNADILLSTRKILTDIEVSNSFAVDE
jgi:glycosyltransferase involved in cell wall biosynthesis